MTYFLYLTGTYPIKPSLPTVGGNEGVGEVVAIGRQVEDLKKGDWVLMANSGLGIYSSSPCSGD